MPPEKTPDEIKAEERKAAAAIRDSIKVEHPEQEEEKKDDTGDKVDEGDEGEEAAASGDPEETKEEVKDTEEKIEASEEKEEELEEKIEASKTTKERERFQRRLDREVSKRKALEEKLAAAEAQLAAKPDASLTPEEVEKLAEQKATQKDFEREFTRTANRLFDEAVKLDKDFKAKVDDLAEDIGPIPSVLVGIIGDRSNGARILKYLVDNHDEAEKYFNMAIKQPIKVAAEMAELNLKLTPVKKVSKVPPPNTPITPNGRNNGVARESMDDDMATWVKKREARLRAEGKL